MALSRVIYSALLIPGDIVTVPHIEIAIMSTEIQTRQRQVLLQIEVSTSRIVANRGGVANRLVMLLRGPENVRIPFLDETPKEATSSSQ